MLYLVNMATIMSNANAGIISLRRLSGPLSVPSSFCWPASRLLAPARLTDGRAYLHLVERIPFHRTYDIAGWTYKADIYCNDCASDRFGRQLDSEISPRAIPPMDQEGNRVRPIFLEQLIEDERCGDCGRPLLDSV